MKEDKLGDLSMELSVEVLKLTKAFWNHQHCWWFSLYKKDREILRSLSFCCRGELRSLESVHRTLLRNCRYICFIEATFRRPFLHWVGVPV